MAWRDINWVRTAYIGFVLVACGLLVVVFHDEVGVTRIFGLSFAGLMAVGGLYPEMFETFGWIMQRCAPTLDFPYITPELFDKDRNKTAKLLINHYQPVLQPDVAEWCKENLQHSYGIVQKPSYHYFQQKPITIWFLSQTDCMLFKMRWL